jgi:DNA repair ATPase RecN
MQFIIYGVLALALLGTGIGIVHVHDGKVKTAALAPWKPLIDECEKDNSLFSKRSAAECVQQWTAAVAANVSLQADVKKNAAETELCNGRVKEIEGESARIDARRAKAESENNPKLVRANARAATLEQSLAELRKAKPEVSCAKAVGKAGASLLDVADERLRDHPPATGDSGSSGTPTAPVRPGESAVRKAGPSPGVPANRSSP